MLPPPYLSTCAECCATSLAEGTASDVVAECILCGKQFLLPLTSSLADRDSLARPVEVTADAVPDSGDPQQRTVHRAAWSIAISALLNVGVLCLLGLFYFRVAVNDGVSLSAEFGEPDTDDLIVLPEFDDGGSQAVEVMLQVPPSVTDIPITRSGTIAASDSTLPDHVGRLGGGSGTGKGGRSIGLFGGVGSAESFAYVVDASGSMSGPRMQLVLNELRESIDSLKEHQEFFVVFFNERTFPMMWPKIEKRLVKADDLNKERVLEWAFRVEPNESTLPEQALRMALRLRPDIVFFLTDGDIPAGSLRIVKKYRHARTSVHTICVGEDAAVPVMQQIAVTGNGEFLMVR